MSNEGGDGNNNNIEYMISPKTRKPPPILLPLPENDETPLNTSIHSLRNTRRPPPPPPQTPCRTPHR
ncbi:unnamed protein product [Brassica napus]|uniref:(rape) hypothetical protein n=1 Tax=Brassica napus TaxID=3708 RepID=A0A816ZTL8_BRANA|nr:unnamed protein product [Brassica napus]